MQVSKTHTPARSFESKNEKPEVSANDESVEASKNTDSNPDGVANGAPKADAPAEPKPEITESEPKKTARKQINPSDYFQYHEFLLRQMVAGSGPDRDVYEAIERYAKTFTQNSFEYWSLKRTALVVLSAIQIVAGIVLFELSEKTASSLLRDIIPRDVAQGVLLLLVAPVVVYGVNRHLKYRFKNESDDLASKASSKIDNRSSQLYHQCGDDLRKILSDETNYPIDGEDFNAWPDEAAKLVSSGYNYGKRLKRLELRLVPLLAWKTERVNKSLDSGRIIVDLFIILCALVYVLWFNHLNSLQPLEIICLLSAQFITAYIWIFTCILPNDIFIKSIIAGSNKWHAYKTLDPVGKIADVVRRSQVRINVLRKTNRNLSSGWSEEQDLNGT